MRRLTLILSDLYLPSEAVPAVTGLDLPHLDWLLRFAGRDRIDDWRSWLSADLGRADLKRMTVAQVCAQGLLPEALTGNAWLATPVHLEARIDHVRLADRGLLRLSADERDSWRQDFTRVFGPDYALHDAGDRGFLLSGVPATRGASGDPPRWLDADFGRALPSPAGELRRLGTEIELWLHGAPVNAAREQRRERRISALWLWGGGLSGGSETVPVSANTVPLAKPRFFGGDAYLSALAGARVTPPPVSFAMEAGEGRCIVELSPMSGPKDEALAALDSNWFAPVRAALGEGELESVDLIANDRRFHISAHPGWRIWRRRSSWLDQLARHLPEAKA
jgi:hypothetical protein